jgi:glycosyltransferase involved in cell wall biosynthesis
VSARPRVGVVVQRYGSEVAGGSESLARAVAVRLAGDCDVSVFTSCALDYVTWRNELRPGRSVEEQVEVLRFPVDEERDLDTFNAFSESLYAGAHSREEELLWLRRQGPYLPMLVESLKERSSELDAILFFTYLYYPTVEGLGVAAERSILVPTAHDEPPLRFGIYDEVFSRPVAFAFLTRPEEELVRSRFDLGDRPSEVTGIGIDPPLSGDVEAFRIRHDVSGPYVLYAGRIDAGKGCAEMLAHFERYRRDVRGAAELLLIGRLAMPEPRQPGVRYLGYLDEAEKSAAMAGARAILCPSAYESLSIVLLEGMVRGVPALASARSPVLRDHCLRSGGGLPYADVDEFVEALDLLVADRRMRIALGTAGRRYVEREYAWDTVMARYRRLIDVAAGRGPLLSAPTGAS